MHFLATFPAFELFENITMFGEISAMRFKLRSGLCKDTSFRAHHAKITKFAINLPKQKPVVYFMNR